MDYVQVDKAVFQNQVSQFEKISYEATGLSEAGWRNALSASYSPVPGLDHMGQYHGEVVEGGAGSAVATLQKYAEQVSWLRDGLMATEKALTGQESFVDRAMQIADHGGAVGEELTHFPERPDQHFDDFSFPSPTVSIPSSLSELSSAFAATDSGAVAATSDSWRQMADNARKLAENIRTTAWDIDEINKAKSIEAAVQRALEIADAADVFSGNANFMAASVEQMGMVEQASSMHVSMAELAIAFIEDPAEREAAEQAFLSSFMGSTFPAAVESVVPSISNLMTVNPGGGGGGDLKAGMNSISGGGGLPAVEQIKAGTNMLQSMVDNPKSITAGSFKNIDQAVNKVGGVGGNAGGIGGGGFGPLDGMPEVDLATHAAHVAGPIAPMSPVGGGSIGPIGGGPGGSDLEALRQFGAMGGINPAGGAATGGVGSQIGVGRRGALGMTGMDAKSGVGGPGAPVGMNNSLLNPQSISANPAGFGSLASQSGAGASSLNQAGLLPGIAGARGQKSAGVGSKGSGGLGSVGGLGTGGMSGSGVSSGIPTAGIPGGLGGVAGSSLAGSGMTSAAGMSSGSSAVSRGAMPFGGMPMGAGAGADSKRSKVKTVTSAIEEEGNMKALIGDLPPVVPGAIGAWARG